MKKNLWAVMALIMCSFSAFAASVGESSGGGYQYIKTSLIHINGVKQESLQFLSSISDKKFNEIIAQHTDIIISRLQFKEIIRNLKLSPLENRSRVNADGQAWPLEMDYENGVIIALRPLFDQYDKPEISRAETYELVRKLFHEATHIFGVGVTNDSLSYNLSKQLMERMQVAFLLARACGYDGDLQTRISDCGASRNGVSLISKITANDYLNDVVSPGQIISTRIYDLRKQMQQVVAIRYNPNVDGLEDPVVACAQMDTLNGQVQWKAPTSAEEIYQAMQALKLPETQENFLLTKKLSVDAQGKIGATWYKINGKFSVMCFGTIVVK